MVLNLKSYYRILYITDFNKQQFYFYNLQGNHIITYKYIITKFNIKKGRGAYMTKSIQAKDFDNFIEYLSLLVAKYNK